jgi:hypothetical protein
MKLRMWWIPQVPGKAFHFPVSSIEEAVAVNNALAEYDLFLLENKNRVDYCNAGGLQVWNEEDQEWIDWWDEKNGETFDEYVRNLETAAVDDEETNE